MKKFGLLWLMLAGSVPAYAQPVMVWYNSHWPPFRIAEGPKAGQGRYDVLMQQLMQALPQYQHQVRQIHLARITRVSASTKESHCTFGLRYTAERASRSLFSEPAALITNLEINFTEANSKAQRFLSAVQAVDMAQLSHQPELLGLLEADRAYPKLISNHLNQEGSNLGSSSMSTLNPAQLLEVGRVDYVVDYPNRLAFFAKEAGLELPLVSRAIEGLEPLSYGYVSCTKSVEGQQWIADINKALSGLKLQPGYRQAMLLWATEPEKQLLLQHYSEFSLQRQIRPEQAETRE
ncbi:hypothetical protein [Rheinheimera sp.]|uniref:hypothetical protein n=1 Tax=Rheinheimera sp. TaxID=1869214 RepID=UPI00307EEEAF